MNRKCLICKKELDSAYNEDAVGEPLRHNAHPATIFRTSGQYGSTLIDDMSHSEELVIILCDSCILENAELIDAVKYETKPRSEENEADRTLLNLFGPSIRCGGFEIISGSNYFNVKEQKEFLAQLE